MTVTPTSPNRAARRSLARRGGAVGAGGVLVAGTAAALLTAFAGQAGASATITVDSSGDGTADSTHCSDITPGNCTIRDAAALAVDGDTITFDAAIGNITLTEGASISLGAVNITGPGSSALTITSTATFALDLFDFQGSGDVTVSGFALTTQRMKTWNQGKFTMNDVSISNSRSAYGGALYAVNTGDLVISGSHFENNRAVARGGAIYAINSGNVTITDSEFIDNVATDQFSNGGGIFLGGPTIGFTLTDSTVTGNTAGNGGGVSVLSSASVTITDSVISSNTAATGGGANLGGQTGGDVSIDRTTIDDNSATTGSGGMVVSGRALVMTDSTISNNQSSGSAGGAKITNSSQVVVNNSTVSGNGAVNLGGGFYFEYTTDIRFNQTTISANTAVYCGGMCLTSVAPVTLELSGTILSGNSAMAGFEDAGTAASVTLNSDHSIVGNTYGIPVTDLGGTIISTTPGLLALADNGGPTMTMALDPTSAAIDAGPNPVATFTGNGFDQRGTPWLRVSNGIVDIGAFEVQATPPPTSSSTTSTTTVPTSSTTSTTAVDPTTTADDDPVIPAFTG